jgi:hypothetical protein
VVAHATLVRREEKRRGGEEEMGKTKKRKVSFQPAAGAAQF